MATINGSVLNTIPNTKYAVASGLDVSEKIILHRGAPDGCVTTPIGSVVCLDIVGGNFYMHKTAGGSTWFRMISGT